MNTSFEDTIRTHVLLKRKNTGHGQDTGTRGIK